MLSTAIVSLIVYLPVAILPPPHRCLPFVLIFLGENQTELAIAATIILSVLLALLFINILIIGFDTSMLKRPITVEGLETSSGVLYVRAQQKKNPDRKIIYYGTGLFLQYVFSSMTGLTIDAVTAELCLRVDWKDKRTA
jgi:hypothetical protein